MVNRRSPGRLGPDFDDFVRSHGTPLLRAAYLLTGDHGHAEDLVQTTLFRLSRHWATAQQAPHSYAYRVLVNLSRNRWRDMSRQPRTVHPSMAAETTEGSRDDPIEGVVSRHVLTDALRRLPEQQRETAVCRFVLDLSVADTAAVLGLAEGTVKSNASRAVARLREYLTEPSEPDNVEVHCAD
jgi:RNA polymerase sigma-70 factor (sigma-E family)